MSCSKRVANDISIEVPQPYNKIGDGPEAPEVKLTVDFLNSYLENKVVMEWVFVNGKYVDDFPEGFKEFEDALPLLVESVNCKGKFIYFTLYNEDKTFYILHSLRMTGRWQKYCDEYVQWRIEDDDCDRLFYRDPRKLGTILFTSDKNILDKAMSKLGPDILGETFTLKYWRSAIKQHRNKNITAFLMDQSIISGCGNYIKAEVLYYAHISPKRKAGDLGDEEVERLYQGLTVISRQSYTSKGVTIRDYKNEDGEDGMYKHQLQIYGKKASNVKKEKTADGRTTYWDPKIQI